MIDLLRSQAAPEPRDPPFTFEVPLSFFEKADAPQGQRRRIGGIMSSEAQDRQGETILQRGLDFDDFIANGWFNDNHSKKTDEILGYPETVHQYAAGQILPDGTPAKVNCTWVEGYLLQGYEPADRIWQLGQALQTTHRRLGFSVEGSILRRQGPGDNIIARAKVRNCAITNCPVNTDARLEVLARSLAAIEAAGRASLQASHALEQLEVEKTLTVGSGKAPLGVQVTGQGAGAVLAREDLEPQLRATTYQIATRPKPRKRPVEKSLLSDGESVAWVQSHVPGVTYQAAADFVRLTKELNRLGYF